VNFVGPPVKGSVPCWKTTRALSAHVQKTRARLPGSLTNQVLVVDRVSLVLSKVVEERLDVGVEGELPGAVRGNEAEHLHRAVWSDVQIPVETSNVDCRNFAADWVDTTDARKPR
jgi:hypothetical protein